MGFFDIFKKENNAKADLSSSDILMISFANKYVSGKDVPRYWKYTYNVDNVFSLIDSLKKRGYIDANGFPTEAGKEVLSKNEYVLYFHKTKPCEIPLEVMEKLVSEHPNTPYRDLIWGEWNRLLLEHMKELNFGSFRNIKYALHKFLVEEKRFVESIPFLAEAFYFDLNNDFSPFIAPALVEDFKNIVNKTNLSFIRQ